MADQSVLATYPMGPTLRSWLGISDEVYRGEQNISPSVELKTFFMESLHAIMLDHPVEDANKLLDLVDELVSMKLPLLGMKIIDLNSSYWDRTNFRSAHTEGIAAMLAGDLERAELCFRHAQNAQPSEPASYANLIQIFSHENRYDEAFKWVELGLKAEPNHGQLWQGIADLIFKTSSSPAKDLHNLAQEYNSWLGISLAIDLSSDGNEKKKAEVLASFYNAGERSSDFLVEYTGALGQALEYHKIPSIVWEAKKLSQTSLSWKLILHDMQAKLALNQFEAFVKEANEWIASPKLPESARQHLKALLKEVEDEQMGEGNE